MLKRLENWLFYIFLFAIPISLRHIFGYQAFGYVEWTAKYIYLTDVLFLGLLGFALWNGARPSAKRADWFLLAFVGVAGLSIFTALDRSVAVFAWLKLLEGIALYFYVKDYALKRFKISHGFEVLVLGGAFQALVGIVQFITQRSLGLKYLGESVLTPALRGIAAFYVNGIKVMRAYGTTPHSNVLAIYLFIALGAFYSIAIYQKRAWWWHVLHAIILWGFLLTFSRVIIGLWALSFLIVTVYILKPSSGRRLMAVLRRHEETDGTGFKGLGERTCAGTIFWTTFAVCAAFLMCYWPYVVNRSVISSGDEAVQLRVLYNQESLKGSNHLLGLGMGNFVPWLMRQNLHLDSILYQPVHNIYLLIYSETGIFAVALFILFLAILLYDFYRRLGFKKLYHFSFGLIIVVVLLAGLFDHFLWTIQTGRLLFWLVLGLLAGAE